MGSMRNDRRYTRGRHSLTRATAEALPLLWPNQTPPHPMLPVAFQTIHTTLSAESERNIKPIVGLSNLKNMVISTE